MARPLIPASLLSLWAATAFVPDGPPQQPNIIFVFPDQMRWSCQGFTGLEPVMTPNIDRFAGQGMILTEAVSNAPVSSPYRAMMLTGKYPVSNGVVSNCTSKAGQYGIELGQDQRCWPDVLSDQGYSLGYIGKWHLDAPHEPYITCSNNSGDLKWNEWTPPGRRHGFDFWYAYGTYDQHLKPMYWATAAPRDSFRFVDQWGPEHEADMAIRYINNENRQYRKPGKPFALVVSMNPPHMPYNQVPEKYVRMYDAREKEIEAMYTHPAVPDTSNQWGRYFRKHIKNQLAMVTGVDEQFGRILEALRQAGLEKNTIVIFTSDHGDCLGKHGQISKSNPYSESMHVPFIIRWPGKIKPGKDSLLFSVPDIYPTLMGLLGFDNEVTQQTEGTGYAALLTGNGSGPRPSSQFYYMTGEDLFPATGGTPTPNVASGERGVRTAQYTLSIKHIPGKPTVTLLFDRLADPMELNKIAAAHPEIVRDLINRELLPWLKKTADPWTP